MDMAKSADGTQIAFERTGSGPPLVFVAGGGGNDHTRWELAGVRPALAEHFTVCAMDGRRGRPGHVGTGVRGRGDAHRDGSLHRRGAVFAHEAD